MQDMDRGFERGKEGKGGAEGDGLGAREGDS